MATLAWANAQGIRNPSDADYQGALLKDCQELPLQEPCLRPDLVVAEYGASKKGLFRLPAQGWDRKVAEDAGRCG